MARPVTAANQGALPHVTSNTRFFRLRNLAALLIMVSGIGQVAMLWVRDLTEAAVIGALLGVTYIIIGIGLLGQSRFTLFVAIVVPATTAALLLETTPLANLSGLQTVRVAIDAAVILCAVIVLLRMFLRGTD